MLALIKRRLVTRIIDNLLSCNFYVKNTTTYNSMLARKSYNGPSTKLFKNISQVFEYLVLELGFC